MKVADDKKKWNIAIVGHVMGNNASFFNMKNFAEQRWNSKRVLEVQIIEDYLFVFRFQS